MDLLVDCGILADDNWQIVQNIEIKNSYEKNNAFCVVEIATAITLGISIAGFVGGTLVKVADLSLKFGRLKEKVENNEKRDEEERGKSSQKFSELYNKTAGNTASIQALQVSITALTNTTNRIETKLDKLIAKEGAK